MKRLLTVMFSALFAGLISFSIEDSAYANYSLEELMDCTLTPEQLAFYNNAERFEEYLRSIGQPTSIRVGAKTLKANKTYALNRCLLVYGTPYDVPSTKQESVYRDGAREYKFLGYAVEGKIYPDPKYPDIAGPNQEIYVKNRPFIQSPWNNTEVIRQGSSPYFSVAYPTAPNTSEARRISELDRAIDRFCYAVDNCRNAEGPRGHFLSVNNDLGIALTSDNLTKYASIHDFPTDYSAGTFSLYYKSANNGVLYYASFHMPPYKRLFDETDLEIKTAFTVNPAPAKMSGTPIQSIVIHVENKSRRNLTDVKLGYGFKSPNHEYCTKVNLPANAITTITLTKGQLSCDNPNNFEALKYPSTDARIKNFTFATNINPEEDNPADEVRYDNNKENWTVRVENPNAIVTVNARHANDIVVTLNNQMMKSISTPCAESGSNEICRSGNFPKTFDIKVYDTNWSEDPANHVLLPDFSFSKEFTTVIAPSKRYVNVDVPAALENEVKRYKIVANIPHYNGEIRYDDNIAEDFVVVEPNLPEPQECKTLGNVPQITKLNGSNGPIKMCVGHYPNFPSTKIEGGMGVYHYVLYRFFPSPFPSYSVEDTSTFTQNYTLANDTDPKTFLWNAALTERGRQMPTSATFNFKVLYDMGTGEVPVAKGTVKYTIPTVCYDPVKLDMLHKQGCDTILFFLPNPQDMMFERPQAYPENVKVDYIVNPITSTKIPMLNPGNYRFVLDVQETSEYRKQTKNPDGTWSLTSWGIGN